MPAFLSVSEPELFREYRLKAIGCEARAERATDEATGQQWHELAVQWHSMADRAADMLDRTR
jgi:hypothetical protein